MTREGATQWPVYLPEGCWHDFWTHEPHAGGRAVSIAAPLERLPLFVRAGALIPLGPVLQHEGERELTEITVLIYPGAGGTSSFTLYEDDGITNAYRRGGYVLTKLSCTLEASDRAAEGGLRTVTCAVGPLEGDCGVVPRSRSYTFQIYAPRPPRSVEVEGLLVGLARDTVAAPAWRHEGGFVYVSGIRQDGSAKLTL